MTAGTPRIRPAALDDIEPILDLMEGLYAEDGSTSFVREAHARAARELLESPAYGRLWVFTVDRRPVGYLALTFGFSLEYRGRDAWIDELYVAPEHRGQGLGRRAIDLAVEECRREGIQAIRLEVETANEAAGNFYRQAGFEDGARRLLTRWLAR